MKKNGPIRNKAVASLAAGLLLCATWAGHARAEYTASSETKSSTTSSTSTTLKPSNSESKASQYAPDNSGKNARDVKGGPPTPENQSENPADLKVTQQIRQLVVDDKTISTLGKNVKIITINGMVTLRGPVSSGAEKELIASKANQVAGAGKVNNQLEVNTK